MSPPDQSMLFMQPKDSKKISQHKFYAVDQKKDKYLDVDLAFFPALLEQFDYILI